MIILKAIHSLTPPPPRDLAPAVVTLGLWSFLAGTEPTLFGRAVLPIWIALGAGTLFWLAGRIPDYVRRARGAGPKTMVLAATLAVILTIYGASFAPAGWMVQSIWIAGSILYGLMFATVIELGDPEDHAMLCPRWAEPGEFTASALWVIAIRNALLALVATSLMSVVTLTGWVVFATLGRVGAYYIGEWLTVRMYLLRHG